MSKILCVPVVNDDGWNAAICSSLSEAPLWAMLDEDPELKFIHNPVRSEVLEGDRTAAALWMLGVSGVVAPEADDAVQERLLQMGIVVVASARAVTVRQLQGPWLAMDLPQFGPVDSQGGSEDPEEE